MTESICKLCLEALTMGDGVEITKSLNEKITEIFPIEVSLTVHSQEIILWIFQN